jgi:hypothetical protein
MKELLDIFDAANRVSRLMNIAEMKREAAATDKSECGNCVHWMKSRICPRERNVNGRNRGPSMVDPACELFKLKPWVAELKAARVAAIEAELTNL